MFIFLEQKHHINKIEQMQFRFVFFLFGMREIANTLPCALALISSFLMLLLFFFVSSFWILFLSTFNFSILNALGLTRVHRNVCTELYHSVRMLNHVIINTQRWNKEWWWCSENDDSLCAYSPPSCWLLQIRAWICDCEISLCGCGWCKHEQRE